MADVQWVKIYTDMFDNRKFRLLELENPKERDLCIAVFFKLLVMAARMNGFVCFNEDKPYTPQQLSNLIFRPQKLVEKALKLLQSYTLIDIDAYSFIKIHGWDDNQSIDIIEKLRGGRAEYMREYRKKKKEEQQTDDDEEISNKSNVTGDITRNITRDVTQTKSNQTDKNRTKKKKKEDDIINNKSNVDAKLFRKYLKILTELKDKAQISINDYNYMKNLLEKKKYTEFSSEYLKLMKELEKQKK